MDSLDIAISSLTSIPVLAFALGILASRLKSDMSISKSAVEIISFVLLLAIGLKGGFALRQTSLAETVLPIAATLLLGCLIPLVAFVLLRLVRKLSLVDRGSIAAHYGSTSLVTFSAGLLFLESNNIFVEGFAPALLTLLEIPGLIVGIFLASRSLTSKVSWGATLKEVMLGKTVLLLAGGLVIGLITPEEGYAKVSPFFVELLNGLLVLFLLHLGYLAGSNFAEIRKVGAPLAAFGIFFPLLSGVIGVTAGSLIGLSVGGATMLGILSASASYIAAPAAVTVALPTASPTLALMSSIGITFPFNLIVGIPVYFRIAELLG